MHKDKKQKQCQDETSKEYKQASQNDTGKKKTQDHKDHKDHKQSEGSDLKKDSSRDLNKMNGLPEQSRMAPKVNSDSNHQQKKI